jgi:hypothetical protein
MEQLMTSLHARRLRRNGAATGPLRGQSALVVSVRSAIVRAFSIAARDARANVLAAGRDIAALTPATRRRLGTTERHCQRRPDALTGNFVTGQPLHIDGVEPLT